MNLNFVEWLAQQKKLGKKFTPEQQTWLVMINNHIASSLRIEMSDFESVPFNQKGGSVKAYKVFGDKLDGILTELNGILTA